MPAFPTLCVKGDELSGGKYVAKPTTAEILHHAGKRTAIAGTKYVTLMHDRRAASENAASRKSFIFFQGDVLPNDTIDLFTKALGPFPGIDDPHADEWTTKALTDVMWKEAFPNIRCFGCASRITRNTKTPRGRLLRSRQLKVQTNAWECACHFREGRTHAVRPISLSSRTTDFLRSRAPSIFCHY